MNAQKKQKIDALRAAIFGPEEAAKIEEKFRQRPLWEKVRIGFSLWLHERWMWQYVAWRLVREMGIDTPAPATHPAPPKPDATPARPTPGRARDIVATRLVQTNASLAQQTQRSAQRSPLAG